MHPTTILVVEDDPMIRLDAVTLISASGHDVVEMESADQALAYVWRHPRRVAAIFSDIELPGNTDGLDLARTVSLHWPHIRLLMTSGQRAESLKLPPATRFLPKPWLPLHVLSGIEGRAASA